MQNVDSAIDIISADQVLRSAENKATELENNTFGVVGIETALRILYTYLVKSDILNIDPVVKLSGKFQKVLRDGAGL